MKCRECPYHLACHSGCFVYDGISVTLCKQCGRLQIQSTSFNFKLDTVEMSRSLGQRGVYPEPVRFEVFHCEKRTFKEARFGPTDGSVSMVSMDIESTAGAPSVNDWPFNAPGPIHLQDCVLCCAHGHFDEKAGAVIKDLDTGETQDILGIRRGPEAER